MSSDEMRVDLESFVNKGIAEGWRGWPLKGRIPCHHEGIRSIYYGPAGSSAPRLDAPRRAFQAQEHYDRMPACRLGDFLGE